MVLWLLHYRNNNMLIVLNKVRYIITDEQILFTRFCKPQYFIFTNILVTKIMIFLPIKYDVLYGSNS